VLGINHFTFVDRARYQDLDVFDLVWRHIAQPDVVREYTRAEVEGWHDWYRSVHQIKFALFQRHGILGAAGDRHLAEFMPGFTRSPDELFRWGVIRTPVAYRIERWQNAPQLTRDLMAGRTPLVLVPSGEEGVAQIKALLGLGDFTTNVNVENHGQIPNLPLGVVVETNARFSRDTVTPLVAGELPLGLHSLVAQHIANQEMIVQAALTRDRDLAFQAVFNDPTNRLPLDETCQMFNEMLRASRDALPGWEIEN
jgi:galacturan 1,4-alpha-galacturonidase